MRANDWHNGALARLASPRSRDTIRRDAYLLRVKLGMENELHFPILHFLENVLPVLDPSFYIEIIEDKDLVGIQAEYVPHLNAIRVKRSVYEAAATGYWWARATLAHELGHYYYHDEKSVRYAKLDQNQAVPPDFDPERQANAFAAELLAPVHLIGGMSMERVGHECGVSFTIAKRQLNSLERIRNRQNRKKEKKKKRLGRKPNR